MQRMRGPLIILFAVGVIGLCVGALFVFGASGQKNGWKSAAANGWVGQTRLNLNAEAPADDRFDIPGYDESWVRISVQTQHIVTAVKYDTQGVVVASENFMVNAMNPRRLGIGVAPQ